MLNKYWRSFPWYIQLIQFIVLLMVLMSFFRLAIAPVIVKLSGIPIPDLENIGNSGSRGAINTFLMLQFAMQIGTYLLPAFFFAYFTHPRPAHYLGLRKPGKSAHWLLPAVIVLCAAPLLIQVSNWISLIDFGPAIKKQQEEHERVTKTLLTMHNLPQLLLTLVVMAVTPSICEEFFFRGIIMRFAAKRTYRVFAPILVSALVFAGMHSSPYSLFSIFVDGLLLASFYYLTGSLWPGIIAHALNNGVQIIMVYAPGSKTVAQVVESNTVPLSWILIGTPLAIAGFYLLWKTKSPLKSYWASDYDPHEIMEGTE